MANDIKLTISNDGSCTDALCRQIFNLINMLTPLVSSYRLEVGSADELNKIALAKRHDVDEALDRADKLGDIIDYVQSDIKKLMRLYTKQIDAFSEEEACRMYGDNVDAIAKMLDINIDTENQ